jgi:hypothetical protein
MRTQKILTVWVCAVFLAWGLGWIAPAQGATLLFDFGNDSSYRGVSTPSPDGNGNHWNSVWSGAYYPNLTDMNGTATAIDLGFVSAPGTDFYNGPSGDTQDPAAVDINAASLGNLGVNEAVYDYYVSSSFKIEGLDTAKTYNLTFFGSHKYSTDDTTVYSVYTDNTFTTVVDSVSLNVEDGSGAGHNRNTVATLNGLSPQAGNTLYIKFLGSGGDNGYLNCLQIEENSGVMATSPDPGEGATGIALTTNVTWNKPTDYTPTKSVLSFRANNPDWLDTPNTTVINPVVNLDLDGDSATIKAAVPVTLEHETTYYWKVTSFQPNSPAAIEHEGPDWSFTTEDPPSPPKLMAHYMPWYKSQPFSGSWEWHWAMGGYFAPPGTIASHYYPLMGAYDSLDPHLLASQALQMKFAGLDGMIADWYGIENFWDYGRVRDATDRFIDYIEMANLKFALCYEDQTVKHMLDNGHFNNRTQAVAHGQAVMEWLQSNTKYFPNPSYLKINSKPVLLCFGPQFFDYSEWEQLFQNLNPQPLFFTLPYGDAPKAGEFDWPDPGDGTSGVTGNLDNFYNRAAGFDQFVGGAFPRFHDIYDDAGGASYGYIDDQNTATFTETLGRGLLSDADIVQIVTWNDYGEGTIVEPTQEDNYTYLEIIQQYRTTYIDPSFSYTAADLRLPTRLYTMRKTYQANPTKMIQLDSVQDYLFADQLAEAETLMNQIDCDTVIVGDFNHDCRVNLVDFELFSSSWLSGPGDLNWDPDSDISVPQDNTINILDFQKFAANWLTISL